MAYTDKTSIEAYIGETLDAAITAAILNTWLAAIKDYIDNYLGFTFESGAALDRYFDGSGERDLFVDMFYGAPTITTLDSDGVADLSINSSYIISYPLNKTQKTRIRLLPGADLCKWPARQYAIKINATWGYSAAAPDAIKLLATRLMAYLIDSASGEEAQSESLGDYSITYAKIDTSADILGIRETLNQYRQISI